MEQSVLLFSSEKQSNPRYNVEKLWIPEISVSEIGKEPPYRNTEVLRTPEDYHFVARQLA